MLRLIVKMIYSLSDLNFMYTRLFDVFNLITDLCFFFLLLTTVNFKCLACKRPHKHRVLTLKAWTRI